MKLYMIMCTHGDYYLNSYPLGVYIQLEDAKRKLKEVIEKIFCKGDEKYFGFYILEFESDTLYKQMGFGGIEGKDGIPHDVLIKEENPITEILSISDLIY